METVSIVVDEGPWTVRVLGRASAGAHAGGAPLLLLGFCRGEESAERATHEALVVGETLVGLGEAALESALRSAREASR